MSQSNQSNPSSTDYVPLARPWFDEKERQAVVRALDSGWWISGPEADAFEREFADLIDVRYAVSVNSGSSALLVAQLAMGIGSGDEVIAPNMSFVSTASASLFLGAIPSFCDITLDDYGMCPSALRECITPKTKLIIPVHYAGQTAAMKEILAIAEENNIPVLEDAAESHLAEYDGRCSGTLGKAGIFSFTPSKPMTTGEGGMIVTNDEDLAKRARLIRSFYDLDKFNWHALGFNFRMPDLLAAIGREQLKKLPESIRQRREFAARYTEAFSSLPGLIPPFVRDAKSHNFQLYTLRLDLSCFRIDRDEWIKQLHELGVGARLYYPTFHDQGVFKERQVKSTSTFPNALNYASTALSLPMYAQLSDSEQSQVIAAVKSIHEANYVGFLRRF